VKQLEKKEKPVEYMWDLSWGKIYTTFPLDMSQYEQAIWPYITCQEEGVAVDVGAHQGFYTVKLGREVGIDGLVLACEPAPQNINVLRRNIMENRLVNVIIAETALSDYLGVGELYTYECDVKVDSGKHFLRGSAKGQPLWDKPDQPVPEPQWATQIRVCTLDSLLEQCSQDELSYRKIDLVKVDVEGGEVKVFQGASKLLKRCSPRLVVEVHYDQFNDLFRVLAPFGYRVKYQFKPKFSPNMQVVYEK